MSERPLPVVPAWRWWSGFGVVAAGAGYLSALAYREGLPSVFQLVPQFDKVVHFTTAGLLAFFLDGALRRRSAFTIDGRAISVAALADPRPGGHRGVPPALFDVPNVEHLGLHRGSARRAGVRAALAPRRSGRVNRSVAGFAYARDDVAEELEVIEARSHRRELTDLLQVIGGDALLERCPTSRSRR